MVFSPDLPLKIKHLKFVKVYWEPGLQERLLNQFMAKFWAVVPLA
jgi:hypothetical protein